MPSLLHTCISLRTNSLPVAKNSKHHGNVLDRVDLGDGTREEVKGSTDAAGDEDISGAEKLGHGDEGRGYV